MKQLGIDYIGLQGYWKVVRDHHPKGYAIGVLQYASGWKSGIKALKKVLKVQHTRVPVVRISGIWHDNHVFDSGDIGKARRIAKKVAKVAALYPDIKFYYQPWLEPRCTKADMKQCCKKCREVLPKQIKLVTGGVEVGKRPMEIHHNPAVRSPYLFSFDGLSMTDTNPDLWKRTHPNSQIFFGWIWPCNGKKDKDDSTPRWRRKNWLTKFDIKEMKRELEQ